MCDLPWQLITNGTCAADGSSLLHWQHPPDAMTCVLAVCAMCGASPDDKVALVLEGV